MNKSRAVVSPSLLRRSPKPGVSSEQYQSFCLGLPEWCPCCIKMAERKRKPLSLKRPRVDQSDKENDDHEQQKISKTEERYLFDVTLEDITKFKEGECPLNTEKNTEWAVRNFEAWQTARNKKFEEQCSSNILSSTDMKELCDWLCKYIAEIRKTDGTEHTPRSLYFLLSGLQRHIRQLNPSKESMMSSLNHSRMFVIPCSDVFMPKVLVLRQRLLQLLQQRRKTHCGNQVS